MKRLLCLFALSAALVAPMVAQPTDASKEPAAEPHLTRFSLDFPGGTPGELVLAIEKATHKPINVIIPTQWADWKIFPLKMSDVDASQLFHAIEMASQAPNFYPTYMGTFNYGFRQAEGQHPTDSTVWYFFMYGTPFQQQLTSFYNLSPYLDSGLTVDDITTAIQTAWRMRIATAPPQLSFHKETKLLIAVGDQAGLQAIDQALNALKSAMPKPPAPAAK